MFSPSLVPWLQARIQLFQDIPGESKSYPTTLPNVANYFRCQHIFFFLAQIMKTLTRCSLPPCSAIYVYPVLLNQ
uniref:Uncharacterized protein n=1 Tax=Arundo donax TaxID=35708 RepID=A0A0A9GX49_ARUDO